MKRFVNFSLVFLVVFLVSCAVAGRYLIDLKYHPETQAAKKEGDKKKIIIYSFEDVRNVSQKNLLGQKIEPGSVEYEFMPMKGSISSAVAVGIIEYFVKENIKVNPNSEVVFDKEKLDIKDGEIAITGKIKDLWIDAFSSFGKAVIKTKVKIEIDVYDVKSKNLIYQTSVESSSENTDLFFSRERAEKYINTTLSTVIEKLLSSEEFRSKIAY